jgi:hypothetical protein
MRLSYPNGANTTEDLTFLSTSSLFLFSFENELEKLSFKLFPVVNISI